MFQSLAQLVHFRYQKAAYVLSVTGPSLQVYRDNLAILIWLESKFPAESNNARVALLHRGPAGFAAYTAVTCN